MDQNLGISDFSLYSIGSILTRHGRDQAFNAFVQDTVQNGPVRILNLDSDGLSQISAAANECGLDFDQTPR